MGYTKDAVKGLSWMSGYRVVTRIIAYLRVAILARLLVPEQFGVFGIASLMLSLLETLTQTGVNVYIVQEKKKLEEFVHSAYLITLVRGIVISSILFLAAYPISSFFKSYESTNLIRLVAVVALVRGFISPSRIKFIKDLEFKKEFWFSFGVFMLDSAVSVGMAFWLRTPISLVYGLLAGAVLEAVMSHLLIKPVPRILKFDATQIKQMLKRGKWITGANIFDYFFSEGDDMFVGKLLNTTFLGIYQAAYKLSTLPLTEITKVFNQVTFPVYTNIGGDVKRLKKAFLKVTLLIFFLILPIGLILYFYAAEIVLIVLGPNWLDVIPVLKILSVFGVVRAVSVSVNPLFNSVKKQNYLAATTLVNLVVMVVTIVPFIKRYGVNGAGYSVLLASVITLPVIYTYLRRIFK